MNELSIAEIELLLQIAVMMSPNSIKGIATAAGIKPSCLYKWKTTDVHLSIKKMDALLKYFIEKERSVLILAEIVKTVLLILLSDSSSFTE